MKSFYSILFLALLAVTAGCQKKEAPMQKKSHSKKTESSHKKSATKKKPCAKKSMEQQDGVMIQSNPRRELQQELESRGMGERSIESRGVKIQRVGGRGANKGGSSNSQPSSGSGSSDRGHGGPVDDRVVGVDCSSGVCHYN